jgi:hypothetical protein
MRQVKNKVKYLSKVNGTIDSQKEYFKIDKQYSHYKQKTKYR